MNLKKIVSHIGNGALIVGITGGIASFGWMFYDTIKTKIEIEEEAKNRNVSVYKICEERGRTDIYELLEIEENLKGVYYIWPLGMPVKVPNKIE